MKLLKELYIQLWSVKDEMENDFTGVLDKLGSKGMGYNGVEFAGFGDLSIEEMKKALEKSGLKALASHTPLHRLINNCDEEIAYQKALGIEYIICPMADMETKSDAITAAKQLTPAAEKIIAAGMKFGYHNHDHEFIKDSGEYLLDILFDNLPESSVMELDIFWSEYAGVDSFAYMEKHKKRLELMHLKQIGKNKENAEVDNGLIDFSNVIKKAQALGVKHFILEQEEYETTSMASAERAVKYLKGL